jgi:hypothetical protein
MRKLVLLGLALAACSDSTGPNTPVMTALVDGTPFVSTSIRPGRYVAGFDTLNTTMLIGGAAVSRNASENIVIVLPHFRGVGQYTMCDSPDSATGNYWVTDMADTTLGLLYDTQSGCDLGEVDVTSYDVMHGQIDGTFHFTAVTALVADPVDTVKVTNGTFDGRFSILSPPPYPFPLPTQHNQPRGSSVPPK